MLDCGTQVLVRPTGPSHNGVLHLGTVTKAAADRVVVEMEGEQPPAELGDDVLVYFQADRAFLQQSAHVEELATVGLVPIVALRPTGAPASAESRQHARVSTVSSDLVATVDGEEGCPLLDVSVAGLAVMSNEARAIGQIVEVALVYDGAEHRGSACVQSARELWEGRFRYGLHSVGGDDDDLAAVLARIRSHTAG